MPIGFGMGVFGKPAAGGNLPGAGVGDAEIGLVATSGSNYTASINYTRYLGPAGTLLDMQNHLSLQQTLSDRNFISVSFSKSF